MFTAAATALGSLASSASSWLATAGSSLWSWLSSGSNLSGLGNFASGIGSAVGGLLGKSKGVSAAKSYYYEQLAAEADYKRNLRALREAPTVQREGLESAGLNPVLYMGNPSYPTSSSGSGVSARPTSHGDYASGFQGLGKAFSALSTLANIKEDLKSKQIANENAPKRNAADIDLIKSQAQSAKEQARFYKVQSEALLDGLTGGGSAGVSGSSSSGNVLTNPLRFYRNVKGTAREVANDLYDSLVVTPSSAVGLLHDLWVKNRSYNALEELQKRLEEARTPVQVKQKRVFDKRKAVDKQEKLEEKAKRIKFNENRQNWYHSYQALNPM